ncbi:MAG: hypothetical protein JNJ40_18105 [Bacteroidia bacterium]|nr:hypothetical protein [Bacteroidia bacterium]
MVEVFKTNVQEPFHADILLKLIHKSFNEVNASFDLEDRDKILRVESLSVIENDRLINLIQSLGFVIEVLPDEAHLN